MGFEVAAALGAMGLAMIALGISLAHAIRCPVERATDEAVTACETAQRHCARMVGEVAETAEQIGRRNSRLAAERSKLERAQKAREQENGAPEAEGGVSRDDAREINRLLFFGDREN